MKNFLKYSRRLGQRPAWVQGAGGNTSVKLGSRLVVKASGFFLKDMAQKRGYVSLPFGPVRDYLLHLKIYRQRQERPFSQWVEKLARNDNSYGRPSIETGLHAVIPSKYVFHTHSVFANIYNFAQTGPAELNKLFGKNEVGFIGYKNPGLELALTLVRALKKNGRLPHVIFLKNHGLITHHDKAETAFALTKAVEDKITAHLKKQKKYRPFLVVKKPAAFFRHMFPDSVVYGQVDFTNLPKAKQRVYYEICSLVNFADKTMKDLGLKPEFLPAAKVKILKGMEQEKYRVNILLKT